MRRARFIKQKIEFACFGIAIHLLIPALLLARVKPLGKPEELPFGKLVNRGLDLLNSHR